GNANFRSGVAKKERGEDPAQEFDAALKSFDLIIKSNDQEVYDEYLAGALYLTGYVNISLDNVDPSTPELCQGLFVPTLTQLAVLLNEKQLQAKELTDA